MNKVTRFISDVLFDKEINLDLFPRKNNDKFWDQFVKTGSSHYVIPALYYKLKERGFLNLLNDELVSYLEEIYIQNYNRNTELVKEVDEISHLLKSNDIDHVFLKGAALVSSIYKESIGIRMIGDIDILISNNQLLKAKALLKLIGYKSIDNIFKPFLKQKKHIPRLISDKKLFAIELHYTLSNKRTTHEKNFLSSKILPNKIFVPNNSNLLYHTIINFQKNDHGSLKASFHFRTLFDIISLISRKPSLIHHVPNSIHLLKIKFIIKKLNIIDYHIPLYMSFYALRFRLVNSIYFFYFLNKVLTDLFLVLSVSPIIRIKQIISLFFRKDYRTYALKKMRIIN